MNYRYSFLIASLVLSSCASMQEWAERQQEREAQLARENQIRLCNAESAYRNGVNDGKNREDMRDYAAICPDEVKAEVARAYHKGYEFGIKNAPSRIDIHTNQQSVAPIFSSNSHGSYQTSCIIENGEAQGVLHNLSEETLHYRGKVHFDFFDRNRQFLRRETERTFGFVMRDSKQNVERVQTRENEASCTIDMADAFKE